MLMTDGRVLGLASDGSAYSLAPSRSTGGYETSAWTTLAPMHDSRLYFGSNVLPDGRVVVVGGELGSGGGKGEVYDPIANDWSQTFNTPASDTETALLPDGRVYIAWGSTIYSPITNTVGPGASYPGNFDEASFVLLPDESFLTIPAYSPQAYRYIPSSNTFVLAGTIPAGGLFDEKQEIGPGLLLANGKVFWLGGNGRTAIYTPPTSGSDPGSWVAGPDIPNGFRADDAPAVVLRNGDVLFLADAGGSDYAGPTNLYVYDPTSNLISAGSVALTGTGWDGASYHSRMVALPTGQVLLSVAFAGFIYTPPSGGGAWAPSIARFTAVSPGTYQLTGTNLHGFSEGAAYGDDAEMSSNFPLVRFECAGGVSYARTFDWAPAVVGLGANEQTTRFSVPPGAAGSCSLVAVANGIPSAPLAVSVSNGTVSGDGCVTTPTCEPDSCGSMTDDCGRLLACGACTGSLVCSANHCCPSGTSWQIDACVKPCKTPMQCCIQGGGTWTGKFCS
jgi:hypothetical protein